MKPNLKEPMTHPPMPRCAGPLRIALVASSLKLAGAEKQTVYMARALFETGTDARFFHVGESGHYGDVLRRMGIPFLQIYRQNRPLSILARLIPTLRRWRPHLVLVPQFGDLLQGGIAGRLCHALTLGGLRSDGFYELNAHGRWSAWMLRLPHGLLANSHRARANLLSQGANPQKIQVLPNVIDLGAFDRRSEAAFSSRIPPGRVVAASVGTLQPCKRVDRFLDALVLARRRAPALFGVIAGADCGSRAALERRAIDLGLAPDHVMFAGECENIPALLTRSAFLVLCSDYEGFPNVILEAMAARLPVITTPVGDADRIVEKARTGYVVDGDDLNAMADRMVELALAPETRTRLGTEGRNRVAREYEYGTLAERLYAAFRDFAARVPQPQLLNRLQAWIPARDSAPLAGALLPGKSVARG